MDPIRPQLMYKSEREFFSFSSKSVSVNHNSPFGFVSRTHVHLERKLYKNHFMEKSISRLEMDTVHPKAGIWW